MCFQHLLCRQLPDPRLAAEQIEALAVSLEDAEQPRRKIHTGHLLLHRRAQELRRQHNARAVRQHQIRSVEHLAQLDVMQRLVGDLRVGRHDISRLLPPEKRLRSGKRLVHRHAVKFQAHYVDLHMQAYPTNLFFIILAHSFPFVYHGRRNLS